MTMFDGVNDSLTLGQFRAPQLPARSWWHGALHEVRATRVVPRAPFPVPSVDTLLQAISEYRRVHPPMHERAYLLPEEHEAMAAMPPPGSWPTRFPFVLPMQREALMVGIDIADRPSIPVYQGFEIVESALLREGEVVLVDSLHRRPRLRSSVFLDERHHFAPDEINT